MLEDIHITFGQFIEIQWKISCNTKGKENCNTKGKENCTSYKNTSIF